MSIKLKILETDSNESELLFHLVRRGRHADIENYFSVERYDLEKGCVMFIRLDCAPEPMFRVGVAENLVMVGALYEHEVRNWLTSWNINFTEKKSLEALTPAEAHAYLFQMREIFSSGSKRKQMLDELKKKIDEAQKKEDQARFGHLDKKLA